MKQFFCPAQGQAVFIQDAWRGQKFGDHFTVSIYSVGQSIIYSKLAGYATLETVKKSVALHCEVARHVGDGTNGYIQIEDYSALKKATIEARKYYIDQFVLLDHRLKALIFCNLSPMMSMVVKIGLRFNFGQKPVYVVRDYKEAICLANQLAEDYRLKTGPYPFGEPVVYQKSAETLIPVEMISDPCLTVHTTGYSTHNYIIDRHILYNVSAGYLQKSDIPIITGVREQFRAALSAHENLDYIVSNVSGVTGGSAAGRKLYMQSLKALYQQFPFRLLIVFGANTFVKTAILMANPFMPFKIKVVSDLDQAFALIQEDYHADKKSDRDQTLAADDNIQQYREDLLAFIGSIDWEQEGLADTSVVDQSHPFYEVCLAIRLIKSEMDDLFQMRQTMQEKIVDSENKYRELFEKSTDLLCTHSPDGTIIDVNIAFKNHYGVGDEVLSGTHIKDLIPERYRDAFPAYLERILRYGHDEGTMVNRTFYDREIVVDYKNVLVKDQAGQPLFIQAAGRDITDRVKTERENRKLQEQLRQKHKMEAIGTLAGGIAHDFNNKLYVITGNAELALEDIAESNPVYKNLEAINAAGIMAAGIVRQLLNFSCQTEPELKYISVKDVVSDTLVFLRSTMPASVKLQQTMPENDIRIYADPAQINQVLLHMVTNAMQAMGNNGGIVDITIDTVIVDKINQADVPVRATGQYARMQISDTGPGIDAENIDKIFDPYFTTRHVGEGSGMGLSVVHGIVTNHNEAIRVDSNPPEGTTFTIYFPVVSEESYGQREKPLVSCHGDERILVVDDEQAVAEMTKKILERLGYQVTISKTPEDAYDVFHSDPEAFDLIITDMIMPRITGLRLAQTMKAIRPEVAIIICSGNTDFIDDNSFNDIGIAACVIKPVTMIEISKTVRRVLDKHKSPGQC